MPPSLSALLLLLSMGPQTACVARPSEPATPKPVTLAATRVAEPSPPLHRKSQSRGLPLLVLKDGQLLEYTQGKGTERLFEFPVRDALLARDGRWLLYLDPSSCAKFYDLVRRRHYTTGVCGDNPELVEVAPNSSRALLVLDNQHWVVLDASQHTFVDLGPLLDAGPNGEQLRYVGFGANSNQLLFEVDAGCKSRSFAVSVSGGEFTEVTPPACFVDPQSGLEVRERHGQGGRIQAVWDEASESNFAYELRRGEALATARQRAPLFRSAAPSGSDARLGRYQVSASGGWVAHQALRFVHIAREPNGPGGVSIDKGGHPAPSVEVGRLGQQLTTLVDCSGMCPFWWVSGDTLAVENWVSVVAFSKGQLETVAEKATLVTPENLTSQYLDSRW